MPARPAADRAPLDVSGRPLALRDVDLDAFLHPKTIAVIGASEQSAKPNTAMTRKFAAWARAERRGVLSRCTPNYETVLGHQVLQVDLRRARRHRPRDHPHRPAPSTPSKRCSQRKAKFAVIFAAGFSETGAEGEKLEARLDGLVRVGRRPPARPEHEPQRVRGLPRRPRRPVDRARSRSRATRAGRVPGPGDRHPAHALGADRQRGRPRVRRLRPLLRRPARGRRDRLLHRGLQGRPHADARRRPRGEAAQADRDGEGRQDRGRRVDGAVAHRPPHRLRRGHRARCSASSA